MRDVKFRAWDKKRKQFIEILLLHYGDDGIFAVTGTHDNKSDAVYFLEDLDLSEYTGLKDKHGKQIYEGDILEGSPYGRRHRIIVEYIDWRFTARNFWISMMDDPSEPFSESMNHWEIIGNIYENHELIGDKK